MSAGGIRLPCATGASFVKPTPKVALGSGQLFGQRRLTNFKCPAAALQSWHATIMMPLKAMLIVRLRIGPNGVFAKMAIFLVGACNG